MKSKSISLMDAVSEPPKSIPGVTAKGRVKFTTMLNVELRQKLSRIAKNRYESVADVLETIISEYLNTIEPNH